METGPVCTREESGYRSPDSCIPSPGTQSPRRQRQDALAALSPPLMTVFMLTHTGRVPSFQLLISFGHRRRPEISLPLLSFLHISAEKQQGKEIRAAFAQPSLPRPHPAAVYFGFFPPLPRSTPVGAGPAVGTSPTHAAVGRIAGVISTLSWS